MVTCGCRRQHFYYYFTDIYDLLRWTFEKEALELLQQQQGVSPWQDGFLHLFQYINQNRAVCLCALDSLGKESLKRLLKADASSIVDRGRPQTGGGKRPVGLFAGGGSGDLPGDHYDGGSGGKLAPG